MDYSHILRSAVPQSEKLKALGFVEQGNELVLKRDLKDSEFYTVISISEKNFTASVYEIETDEKYALFDMPSANGAFIGGLREKVAAIIESIVEKSFTSECLYEKYVQHLLETYKCPRDFPWEDSPDCSVFRCPNDKWFALIMDVSFKSLGMQSEEKVFVVNLKADAEKIPELVDKKSIFPAYHMNKKYWITVLLTAVTDYNKLCELTKRSYELVTKKV